MLVIVPSRGRPENIDRLNNAWIDTGATTNGTQLLIGLDDDDPTVGQYHGWCQVGPRERMAGTLNTLARQHAPMFDYVGFMGDDHLPRTPDWDRIITRELDTLGTGVVYGNDLIQGAALPTAVFMTSDIIRTLGWMCPPGLIHLFLDNFWKELGERIGRLTYLPEVIIEHLHPIAQKTEWDAGYAEVNAPEMYDHDRYIWLKYRDNGAFDRDIEKLKAVL